MLDKGRGLLISRWWWRKPKKPVGKGAMHQSPITGQWHQEHKPDKSMRLRQWIDAANHGQAFKGKKNFFNKNRQDSRPIGYTNNPKYFNKKSDETFENSEKKSSSLKGKKRFKNRKRPKNFSFKKFKKTKY